MTPEVHALMIRVGEAVRDADAKAAYGTASDDERGGRYADASAQKFASARIRRVDVAAIVATIVEVVPTPAEQDAFDAAAKVALHNTVRRDGEFIYPQTARAFALWQAAVRWARLNPDPPS